MSRIINPNAPRKQNTVGSKMQELEHAVISILQGSQIRQNQIAVFSCIIREFMGLSEDEFVAKYEETEKRLIEQSKAKDETNDSAQQPEQK